MKTIIILSVVIVSCCAQRPSYAGRLPIGYPVIQTSSTTVPTVLGNRFGDDDVGTTTTIRLPLEALGDADLVARLSNLPTDKQPFWLINWKFLEENRKNPQTYQQRENSFIDRNSNPNEIVS